MYDIREKLTLTYTADKLPCRDKECQEIKQYIVSNLKHASSGTIYISGMPGTGKTACVRNTINAITRSKKPKFSFNVVDSNGMQLGDASRLLLKIHNDLFLTDKKSAAKRGVSLPKAFETLKGYFLNEDDKLPTVLIIDELDVLINKKQRLLYSIFDWATKDSSLLTIVAIANTLDLPERTLISRISSRFGLNRLCFQPYNHDQIERILIARLEDCAHVEADTLRLIARKVAAVSGDLRRALEICRLAFDLFLREIEERKIVEPKSRIKTTKSTAELKFSIKYADEALKRINSSVKVAAVRNSSTYELTLLRAMLAEYSRTGCDETTCDRIFQHYKDLCHSEGLLCSTYDQFMQILFRLGETRLIVVDYGRELWHRKLRLNVNPDDLSHILKSL